MGFPRILSKNNKIYTKLGDFCLSGDGTNFWILCHTCQEELQTQDHFWKHIQDEHNFLHGHGLRQESRSNISYMDASEMPLALPLYRKLNDEEQRVADAEDDDDSQEQHEPKDYTEMRAIDASPSSGGVEIDIKMEPASLSQPPLPPPSMKVEINTTPTLYQLPTQPTVGSYATIVHTPTTLGLPNLTAQPSSLSALLPQQHHELPKDSNSTTASASSAVSSDDGERWYICDHETCGLKFKYQSRLELHRSVHSKERRFACELCGASFKQSCNLSTHRKKKHFLKGSKSFVPQQQQQQQQRF